MSSEPLLPEFRVLARRRPFGLLAPRGVRPLGAAGTPVAAPQPAPFAALVARLGADAGDLSLTMASGPVRLTGHYDATDREVRLTVTGADGRTTQHRSRRHGSAPHPVNAVALTLTGSWVTVWTAGDGHGWMARGRYGLEDRVDSRAESFCASLTAEWSGTAPVTKVLIGPFGQLGLRDLRLVSEADGSPVRRDGRFLLSATSAGPGFFDTGHTSVWSLAAPGLEPESVDLRHEADLFFRRPDRPGVFGDHATHVVRDGGRWLVATSTWGDFRRDRGVRVTLAATEADVTTGSHVLDTTGLGLPGDGHRSVGVWDPHLVRAEGRWLVGYVSATRFFRFHPVLAGGPTLDDLALLGSAPARRATEGITIAQLEEGWHVVASDGRDGRRGQRARFPVFDLTLTEVGALRAPYPTNLPWPTLARTDDGGWLMVTFNGRPRGGRLLGYGTHGDVVVMRGAGPGRD